MKKAILVIITFFFGGGKKAFSLLQCKVSVFSSCLIELVFRKSEVWIVEPIAALHE